MRRAFRIVTLSAVAASAGCAPAAPKVDTAAIEQTIRQEVKTWNGYLAAGNDSAVAALYTEDAVLMPPNLARISGRASIRQFWAQFLALKVTGEISTTSVQVASSGDLAVEAGTYHLTVPTPGGPQTDTGKYLVSWTRGSDGWHVVWDIWNSDQPLPAAPPAK